MAQRKLLREFAIRVQAASVNGREFFSNRETTAVASSVMQIRRQHTNRSVNREAFDKETNSWQNKPVSRSFNSPEQASFADSVRSKQEMEFALLCQSADIEPKIGFIGGGNMAQAMIKGFLSSGLMPGDQIGVSDPNPQALEAAKDLNVCPTSSNDELLANYGSGVLILAIKPDMLETVLTDSKDLLKEAGLIVSIIAGAKISTIESALDGLDLPHVLPVVRVMPNTAAIIGCAASVYCRGTHCTDAQAKLVSTLMETIGTCHEVAEKNLDAVTGLSGSGPAYVYTMIDALSDGGVKTGLNRALATHLAAQTVMGAAKMVLETSKHPGELKNMVCSPGGTTITGVSVLEERNVRGTFIAAVEAAAKKSEELGKK